MAARRTATTPFSHGDGPIDDCLSIRSGALFIEGCDSTKLAARFGTPLYVMSDDQVRRNVRTFQAEFQRGWPDGPVVVMPSIKANYGLALRRILTEEGAGCDTFGPGELHAALSTGVPPDLISFNGSSKTEALLVRAVTAGARITLDSAREVDLVIAAAERAGRTAKVRLRVRPDFDIEARSDFYSGPVSLRTASQMYKPGIPTEELAGAARRLLDAKGVELTGVMMHAGRHTTNLRVWGRMMQSFVEVIGRLRQESGGWEPRRAPGSTRAKRPAASRGASRPIDRGVRAGHYPCTARRADAHRYFHCNQARGRARTQHLWRRWDPPRLRHEHQASNRAGEPHVD